MKHTLLTTAALITLSVISLTAQQAEASSVATASVVAGVSVASAIAAENGSTIITDASKLVVKSSESIGKATIIVVESASTGARYSLKMPAKIIGHSAHAVGAILTASTSASGTLLTNAGKAVAFIPNELARSMLHNSEH